MQIKCVVVVVDYYPAVAKCFSYQMKDDYVALGPFFSSLLSLEFIDQLFLG